MAPVPRPQVNADAAEWRALARYVAHNQTIYRTELEAPGCDPRRADFLRGKIDECSVLLRLGDPARPEQFVISPDYSRG